MSGISLVISGFWPRVRVIWKGHILEKNRAKRATPEIKLPEILKENSNILKKNSKILTRASEILKENWQILKENSEIPEEN